MPSYENHVTAINQTVKNQYRSLFFVSYFTHFVAYLFNIFFMIRMSKKKGLLIITNIIEEK